MRARLLAFSIAVLMVVAAIVARNRIDQHHENSTHPLRLVCSNELQAACEALPATIQITYESAAQTANALSSTTPPAIDGWLTTGPWPAMVQERRQRNGQAVLLGQSQPLARSRVVVVAFPDRAQVIKQNCPNIDLKCVVGLAGKGAWTSIPGGKAAWGQVKVSLTPPNAEASGLVVLGAATANLFGSANLSSTDLDDPNFDTWLKGLAGASRGDQLGQMVAVGPAVADFAITLDALAQPLVAAAANKPSLLYPATVTSADVVLGTLDSSRSRRLANLVRSSKFLDNAGWQSPSTSPSGLPPAGFLDALRAAWGEAAR
ncbi:MAG TPA: hypothetical protein VFA83_09065 [Acidimicrobiales bacterium]|nr:hypothetical protein [Acidimicrobiales bacterium]